MTENRIALLGAGRMARVHAQTLTRNGYPLAAVYDVAPDAAAEVAAEHGGA